MQGQQKASTKTSTPIKMTEKLGVWLELLRLPNLFTVPGDVLAGYAIASFGGTAVKAEHLDLAACLLASIFVYCAGLLQNDYCDRAEDARLRPQRPLPSGRVSTDAVRNAAVVLFLAGLSAAACAAAAVLTVCVVLVLLVVLYNSVTKHVPVWGALNMGLCRGVNLLLGAALCGWQGICYKPGISAVFLTLYIAFVTVIARDETRKTHIGFKRWILPAILVCWYITQFLLGIELSRRYIYISLSCLSVGWIVYLMFRLGTFPAAAVKMQVVASLIRALILIQVVMLSGYEGIAKGAWIVLLIAWPVSGLVSKRFYSS